MGILGGIGIALGLGATYLFSNLRYVLKIQRIDQGRNLESNQEKYWSSLHYRQVKAWREV